MATVKDFSVEEKLASLVTLQKIESKLDEIQVLKGELPMEVSDLEDEITGLHARQTRVEEEIKKAKAGGLTDSATGTALILSPLYDRSGREIDRFILDLLSPWALGAPPPVLAPPAPSLFVVPVARF